MSPRYLMTVTLVLMTMSSGLSGQQATTTLTDTASKTSVDAVVAALQKDIADLKAQLATATTERAALLARIVQLESAVKRLEDAGGCKPVNCVQTPFTMQSSGQWSACSGGKQTRDEVWVRTTTTDAACGGAACGPLTENRVAVQACSDTPPAGDTITVSAGSGLPVMRGWEVVAQAEQNTARFAQFSNAVFDKAAEVGVNRIRLEVRSGSENPTDSWTNWKNAGFPSSGTAYTTWRAKRYEAINDNSNPNSINAAGFKWSELDDTVDKVVLPLAQRLQAKGESLYVVLTYVAFTSQITSGQYAHGSAAEYAEFVLATFQHLQSKYGSVPNAVELVLEPDNVTQWQNPTLIGQTIVATGDRLAAAGFKPDFIAPSTTNMGNAVSYFDGLVAVPNVKTYLKEIAYHRYSNVTAANLAAIAQRAVQHNLATSMLEWWDAGNTHNVMHEDLTTGRNSAWEMGVLAGTGGGQTTLLHVDASNNVTLGPLARYAELYWRYVRMGAQRLTASSSNAAIQPIAWRNTDGKHVIVAKTTGALTFSVTGVPVGSYGVRYVTATGSGTLPDGLSATIPAAGVVVFYAKTASGGGGAVDCVTSAWSMASATSWSTCTNGTQTRSETWTRTVITPASGGGAACGPLTETRTGSQSCGGSGGTRTLIGTADLQYAGFYQMPPGMQMEYSTASLGIRYVGGERRFLMANFTNQAPSGRFWDALIEFRCPNSNLPTSGDPTLAPTCTDVRRWQNWTVHDSTPTWHDSSNSVRLGAVLWDEANGGVWYSAFGYYSSKNMPWIGFTKLNDDLTVTRYGPWWWKNNNPADSELHMKRVSQGLIPVPVGSQSALGGRQHLAFANPGSLASQGHLGIGLTGVTLPNPFTTPANSVLSGGLPLADYSPDSTERPQHARRPNNYTALAFGEFTYNNTGLQPGGYWQMNLDQVNGCAWIETPTKEGVLCYGRSVSGKVAYGWNPLSTTPGWTSATPELIDPSMPIPNGNGYKGEFWNAAIYRFDPKQLRDVAAGTRSPTNTGINPENIGSWKTLWPGMPSSTGRHMDVAIGSSLVWDGQAKDLIWCNPTSAGARPVCHVWRVQ